MTNTSAAAFNRGEEGGSIPTYREVIVDILKEHPDGLILDEIHARVQDARKHSVEKQSISPRMRELERKGQVVRTDLTRSGRSDNEQVVWKYQETEPDPFTVRAGFINLWTTDPKAEKTLYMVECPHGRSHSFETLEAAHGYIRSLTFGDKVRKKEKKQ